MNLNEVYAGFPNPQRIFILGCGPSLNNFNRKLVRRGDIVLGLNSSFLYYPPHLLFFACHRFVARHVKYFSSYKNLSVVFPNCFSSFGFYKEYSYKPSRLVTKLRNNNLRAGSSVLIPALHLSLLLQPKIIYLFGIDLENNFHWNDLNNFNEKTRIKFPATNRILEQVVEVLKVFPSVLVKCPNTNSALCQKGIVAYDFPV